MPKNPSSSGTNVAFLALKGLAWVAEIAMAGGVIYAAATALRYWPHINV